MRGLLLPSSLYSVSRGRKPDRVTKRLSEREDYTKIIVEGTHA
jgi:hypothetical protein